MYLFVYYKIEPDQHAGLQSRVKAMQHELAQEFPDVVCQLLKRPECDEQKRETWMETYHLPGVRMADFGMADFRARLDILTQDPHFPSPRRNEIFISQF